MAISCIQTIARQSTELSVPCGHIQISNPFLFAAVGDFALARNLEDDHFLAPRSHGSDAIRYLFTKLFYFGYQHIECVFRIRRPLINRSPSLIVSDVV